MSAECVRMRIIGIKMKQKKIDKYEEIIEKTINKLGRQDCNHSYGELKKILTSLLNTRMEQHDEEEFQRGFFYGKQIEMEEVKDKIDTLEIGREGVRGYTEGCQDTISMIKSDVLKIISDGEVK